LDDETGLHYNWNRFYDPDIGRYISADSIGLRGGLNLYTYVLNNPVSVKDITGLISIYGNWCGPNWTGGRNKEHMLAYPGYFRHPIDDLDTACENHDICYYRCRSDFPCSQANRSRCFRMCDFSLTSSAYSIGGFWGNIIGAAIDRPGERDPGPDDCSCVK
jgi:hypothetical protein